MTISHELIPELQTDDHLYPGVVAERSASTLDIDSPTITDLPQYGFRLRDANEVVDIARESTHG
jgi:hypothetical protein